jgi:uncharacterized membrane protein
MSLGVVGLLSSPTRWGFQKNSTFPLILAGLMYVLTMRDYELMSWSYVDNNSQMVKL